MHTGRNWTGTELRNSAQAWRSEID